MNFNFPCPDVKKMFRAMVKTLQDKFKKTKQTET